MRTAEARAVLPGDGVARATRCTRRRRSPRWRRRSPAATTHCSAARSRTGSRSPRAPGCCRDFAEAKAAALAAGALGSSISGSGPTAFALVAWPRSRRASGGGHGRGVPRGRNASEARVARWIATARGCRADDAHAPQEGHEVPDPAPGQLAGVRGVRRRDHRARSAPALRGLRRPARGSASPADPHARRAHRALHRAARAAARRDGVGRVALPGDRPPVGGGGGVAPRGQHAAAPPPGARPLDRCRPPAAQARGPQSDGLVQGPRHDGRRDPGRRIGATAVACASTGNTSASLAAYAAQAGIPALVLVPADKVAIGKLAQTLAYGARTLLVRGDFDACLRLVRGGERRGWASTCSTRSIRSGSRARRRSCSRCCSSSTGSPPTGSCFPAGNLGNTAAFGKALLEAHRWGLISRLPRLAAVQAAGAAPFARSFAEDFAHRYAVQRGDRRHRDPHRRSRLLRPRGPRHPRDRRRGPRGDRRGDPRGQGRRRRGAASAASRRARRASRACANWCAAGSWRRRRRGGGAHRPHPQGPGPPAQVPPRDGPAAPAREPADRDRARARGDRTRYWPRPSPPPQRFTIRQIVRLSSAERNSAPSLPSARPTARSFPFASVAKVW